MSGEFNPFEPPRESIVESLGTPRGSQYLGAPTGPQPDRSLASTPADSSPFLNAPANKETYGGELEPFPTRPFYKRPWFWLATAGGIAVIVLAVILPVYFTVIKPNQHHSTSSASSSSSGSNPSGTSNSNPNGSSTTPKNLPVTGGDGSTVTMENGTTFTYNNPFGGFWIDDPANPFNDSARPNSWTPALNEPWQWGVDRIWGVNLGGLFVLEPFIVPSLYEQNVGAIDEWTLSQLLAAKGADNLQQTLENHYSTFVTEEDIAQIAGAGLNWIRLPVPFWAIEAWANVGVDGNGQTVAEPFLVRVCWNYILKVLGWARKYGIRVNLDLHTMPGSQNGYNHSGKFGSINWMKTVMGLANAERSLDYIRIFTEFISQPEWKNVVPMFGVVNEPYMAKIGQNEVQSFYLRAYNMIREITGTGEGNGPMIAFHDGFGGVANWAGFLSGADRVALDTHPYFAFDSKANREPVNITADGNGAILGGQWPLDACNSWGTLMNNSRTAFGVTVAGEFANAINDCGLFVDGITADGASGATAYGVGCDYWEDYQNWSDETKQGLLQFALASMDSLGDWFFWTWKIGPSTTTNTVLAPLWSYQLGLQNGWMPTDPRKANGMCASLGANLAPFDNVYQPWMTGGAGAGTITAQTADLVWPPTAFTDVPQVAQIPQYTPTGTINTLPPPTYSATVTASIGNGWFNAQDNTPAVTPIAGCTYPDAWDAADGPAAAGACLPARR